MGIKTVLLNKVNIGEPKSGTTKGKDWKAWNVGVEVDGEWHNGFFFDKDFVDEIGAHNGETMTLAFYEEPFKDIMQKKFKKVSSDDLMNIKFVEIENRLQRLENEVFPFQTSKEDEKPESESPQKEKMNKERIDYIDLLAGNVVLSQDVKDRLGRFVKADKTSFEAEEAIKSVIELINEGEGTVPDRSSPF